MLKLTRKAGESVMIGSNVNISVLKVNGSQVEIGIDTPKEMAVYWVEIDNETSQEDDLIERTGAI